jgi:hypothetical protein
LPGGDAIGFKLLVDEIKQSLMRLGQLETDTLLDIEGNHDSLLLLSVHIVSMLTINLIPTTCQRLFNSLRLSFKMDDDT